MTERKTYDVTARKDGRWWFVQVPELDTVGQARSAAEVEEVAREVIALWSDVEPDTFDVNVSIELPGEARAAWEESKARESVARQQNAAAAALARRAVQRLRADGLTFRDAGIVLGLSPQRVQQLAASAEAEPEPERVEEPLDARQAMLNAVLHMEHRDRPNAEIVSLRDVFDREDAYLVQGAESADDRYVFFNWKSGGWDVLQASDAQWRAAAHFDSKDDAIARAMDIVATSGSVARQESGEGRRRRAGV